MAEIGEFATWVDGALATLTSDLGRARGLVCDAASTLFRSFDGLRQHLATERASYEAAVDALTGSDEGLAGALRAILARFVGDIADIGRVSARIQDEVVALRTHADEVAARGNSIQKIAHATRLISFNAHIEAERVGGGAVFRVVADEIKRLATETATLSKAIRVAIDAQDASLTSTASAASSLAAYDLAAATARQGELSATITRLEQVSESSKRLLADIQVDIDAAIRALQFEDMVTQLIDAVIAKLSSVRGACAAVADGADLTAVATEAERTLTRDAVTQRDVTTGSIELF